MTQKDRVVVITETEQKSVFYFFIIIIFFNKHSLRDSRATSGLLIFTL